MADIRLAIPIVYYIHIACDIPNLAINSFTKQIRIAARMSLLRRAHSNDAKPYKSSFSTKQNLSVLGAAQCIHSTIYGWWQLCESMCCFIEGSLLPRTREIVQPNVCIAGASYIWRKRANKLVVFAYTPEMAMVCALGDCEALNYKLICGAWWKWIESKLRLWLVVFFTFTIWYRFLGRGI